MRLWNFVLCYADSYHLTGAVQPDIPADRAQVRFLVEARPDSPTTICQWLAPCPLRPLFPVHSPTIFAGPQEVTL